MHRQCIVIEIGNMKQMKVFIHTWSLEKISLPGCLCIKFAMAVIHICPKAEIIRWILRLIKIR